jgi:hypothetical protein
VVGSPIEAKPVRLAYEGDPSHHRRGAQSFGVVRQQLLELRLRAATPELGRLDLAPNGGRLRLGGVVGAGSMRILFGVLQFERRIRDSVRLGDDRRGRRLDRGLERVDRTRGRAKRQRRARIGGQPVARVDVAGLHRRQHDSSDGECAGSRLGGRRHEE